MEYSLIYLSSAQLASLAKMSLFYYNSSQPPTQLDKHQNSIWLREGFKFQISNQFILIHDIAS